MGILARRFGPGAVWAARSSSQKRLTSRVTRRTLQQNVPSVGLSDARRAGDLRNGWGVFPNHARDPVVIPITRS